MNLSLFILVMIVMISNLISIIFFTPMVPDQEWAQKIFYLHVPIAWSGFIAYFFVMISGIAYLISRNLKYDRFGHAAAEVGTIFTGLVLLTGPIWATPIWGKPWIWEPRLITTLVLFVIYAGYFILRNVGIYRQRVALISAMIGIIAFLDIPIIFASVTFWAAEIQSHPQVEMSKQPSGILTPFLFSLFAFTNLMLTMLFLKIKVLYLQDKEKNYV
ncbi:MAG: cytochrome c biogenesis protein CcsA [Candidatus Marinimicrobia bacterium]|jgi:heme exporter protein C|nr:cytochrome c biogenesis protein CcsA [Pelagibacterales bacterium]MBL6911622.1 cytochrome c biogenesis protein CcsA [Candidatus Neomarinimicrobiota bacterium]MBT4950190.1 cytochrome c biogenesis protein CcsA [Pelagibacteraceae bacterium]MBT3944735.1 cytochrome c biogenesis protein CcsA [Candidatus Neomarinimicrobiota bacterium]MBT4317150.1 cytochrome c biogenesis protein CcsA [Candidatus Neomarinimicrobiota bacterium]